jgi:hypothetical protein
MQKNVSAVVTPVDLQAVITSIQQVEAKLPFLISLSQEERIHLTKMGPKSVDFVSDAAEAIKAFPSIMPPTFDKAEFTKDTELVKALVTIKMYADSLQQKVDDTLMEVGSEAMVRGLEVYAQVHLQQENIPGLRSAFDKLKSRFAKTKRKPQQEVRID